jgi:hypothetical protein
MTKHTYRSANRRDLIRVGLFAGASLSLPLSRGPVSSREPHTDEQVAEAVHDVVQRSAIVVNPFRE